MKFLYKKRRFITSVLVVTVSLMLFLFSLPASATDDNGLVRFSTLTCTNGSILNAGNATSVYMAYNGESQTFRCNINPIDYFVLRPSETRKSIYISVRMPLSYKSFFSQNRVRVCLLFKETDLWCTLNLDFCSASKEQVGMADYGFMMTADNIRNFCNNGLSPQTGLSFATVVGIGFYLSSDTIASYSGRSINLNSVFIDDVVNDTGKLQKEANQYLFDNLLGPAFTWLGNFLSTAFQIVAENFIIPAISTVGLIFQDCFNVLKPFLTSLFDNLLLPTLNSMLTTLNNIVSALAQAISPLLVDMINYFSPYFNEITTLITDKFIDLWTGLSPILNQFITDISPAFDSIVEGIASNLSRIFNECFVPDNSSQEFQEFVGMKDTVENKFPVFVQVKTFLSVLFNPNGYTSGSSVQYSNLIQSYDGFTTKSVNFGRSYYFDCVSGKTYTLSICSSGVCGLSFIPNDGSSKKSVNGSGVFSLTYTFNYTGSAKFSIYFYGNSDVFTVSDVCLYSVDSSAGQEFTVNLYGKNVSVLNFDWYMPYKHYGDICVIAFCYLAFIWHTFKRLPSMI